MCGVRRTLISRIHYNPWLKHTRVFLSLEFQQQRHKFDKRVIVHTVARVRIILVDIQFVYSNSAGSMFYRSSIRIRQQLRRILRQRRAIISTQLLPNLNRRPVTTILFIEKWLFLPRSTTVHCEVALQNQLSLCDQIGFFNYRI